MVDVEYDAVFEKQFRKIKDALLKLRVKKQIQKIVEVPDVGKPMRYWRKGTREVYVSPFRLAYLFDEENDLIVFLELYHKDEQ